MSDDTQESSSPQEGPASLREALEESFFEVSNDYLRAEPTTEMESTDSVATNDDAQPPTIVEQEAAANPSEERSQGADEVISAPEHWSAEDRELFTELPSAAQSAWLRREKEYEQGIQKKAEEVKPLQEAFGQYREVLKMRGVNEADAIRAWSTAQSMLDADPINGLKMLIQQFGPDVQSALAADFGLTASADESGEYVDPEVAELKRELATMKQRTAQTQSQYQALRQQEAMQAVRTFKEEVDENGNPTHPFFDDVVDDMRAMLSSGVAPDLQTAYDKCVWSLPAYREDFAKRERTDAEQQATKKREEAAKRAKKTAKSVNGKTSVPPAPQKDASLADDLRDAWNQSVKGAN